MKNKLLIVGDKFKSLDELDNVISINHLHQEYENNTCLLGQGLSTIDGSNLSQNRSVNSVMYNNLCDSRYVHKNKEENILITEPKCISNNKFECTIVINENNELIIDHTTG